MSCERILNYTFYTLLWTVKPHECVMNVVIGYNRYGLCVWKRLHGRFFSEQNFNEAGVILLCQEYGTRVTLCVKFGIFFLRPCGFPQDLLFFFTPLENLLICRSTPRMHSMCMRACIVMDRCPIHGVLSSHTQYSYNRLQTCSEWSSEAADKQMITEPCKTHNVRVLLQQVYTVGIIQC